MNDQLFNIALLIIVACNLGMLWLYFSLIRRLQIHPYVLGLLENIEIRLTKFARDTDYDFRAIKTRLRDEEKDDQRAKRRARRQSR